MKASTGSYIELQKLYKDQAGTERDEFRRILDQDGKGGEKISEEVVDSFVRNAHGLRVLIGKPWTLGGGDSAKLGMVA
jgi:NEDD8-activating enzyme E1 regulatory subunit